MSRLTIADVEILRAKYAPLPSTIAPFTSSDNFRSEQAKNKPECRSMNHHFSLEAHNFAGSAMKKTASPASPHKIIALGTGRPTADYCPWESLFFGGCQPLDINGIGGTVQTVRKYEGGYNLAVALNYGQSVGSPQLICVITEHVEMIHSPPYANWGVRLSPGPSSAIEVALRMLCNRGDIVLTEEYTYPGFIEVARLVGAKIKGIGMESSGLQPELLEAVLEAWDDSNGRKPTILYMIPTDASQPIERKKAIMKLLINMTLLFWRTIHPYYFLNMRAYEGTGEKKDISNATQRYLSNLPPSYISLDRSARVVRLDST